MSRTRYFAIILSILSGTILSLFPFLPQIDRMEIIQTEVRRVDQTPAVALAGSDAVQVSWPGETSNGESMYLTDGGQFSLPVIDLGMRASSVGIHWIEGPGSEGKVVMALRTSADGQSWADWQHVDAEGETVVAQGRKVFGSLVAAGGDRFVQYRLTRADGDSVAGALASVSVFGLNSATAPVRHEWHIRLEPRDRALATIKPLGIISRREWGADERLRFERKADSSEELLWPEEVAAAEKIIVHHTAGPNVCSSAELYCQRRSVVAINDIYYYHAVVNGWGDIGYNSLVGYDGRIYEGRHGPGEGEPLAQPVVAGHALGHNNRTHGVALMGDFSHERVPELQYDALAKTIGWIVKSQLAAKGAVDPLGFSPYVSSDGRASPPLPNIIGHRDVNDTECPGDYLQERLIELRHLAESLVDWPPVNVALRARPAEGDAIAYHVLVDNHEPEQVRRMIVKGAIPANTTFVDSWAGSPFTNRGVFDGSVVTWYDPEAQLSAEVDRREYVFIVRPKPGVSRAEVRSTAWVEFREPTAGIAMSEAVSADQPVDIIGDPVVGGRVTWTGEWPVSRNVAGYYGDAYQYHDAGNGEAVYTWEVSLFEPGHYEVFAWWSSASDRATNATYLIETSDGPRTVQVNQRAQGARWVSLGRHLFSAGHVRIALSDRADNTVIADAVRFRRSP